jgi:hypothetical protein
MALRSTQSLTETSTNDFPGGKGGRCVGQTRLPPSCANCLKSWKPDPIWSCKEITLLFSFTSSQSGWTALLRV